MAAGKRGRPLTTPKPSEFASLDRRRETLVARLYAKIEEQEREIKRLKGLKLSDDKLKMRGRGPNVREVALQILGKRGAMNIAELAVLVIKQKGGQAGANFTQNLGAALNRDKRFKRIKHGVYGLRG